MKYTSKIIFITAYLLSCAMQNCNSKAINEYPPRDYNYSLETERNNYYKHIEKSCLKPDCYMGGCRYTNCGMENYLLNKHSNSIQAHTSDEEELVTIDMEGNVIKEDEEEVSVPSPSCNGGMCEFIECVNPSCKGGACTFIRCVNATCDGGGCKHVNPKNTLKENYCKGGGCTLNGKPIPSSWKNQLVY